MQDMPRYNTLLHFNTNQSVDSSYTSNVHASKCNFPNVASKVSKKLQILKLLLVHKMSPHSQKKPTWSLSVLSVYQAHNIITVMFKYRALINQWF